MSGGTQQPYRSAAQQTLLRVIEALAVNPMAPKSTAHLTKAVEAPRDQVFRALQNLALADWAGQLPDGGWRLTPRATRISEEFRLAIADAHRVYLAGLPGVLDPDAEPEPEEMP